MDIEKTENTTPVRRRKLLPWWIKMFIILFGLISLAVPVALVYGVLGKPMSLSIYGLETIWPFSHIGLFILLIFSFKSLVAYGLWFEKDHALIFAKIDAVFGIVVCLSVMLIMPLLSVKFNFQFRLELILLLFYFNKIQKLNAQWIQLS